MHFAGDDYDPAQGGHNEKTGGLISDPSDAPPEYGADDDHNPETMHPDDTIEMVAMRLEYKRLEEANKADQATLDLADELHEGEAAADEVRNYQIIQADNR